MRYWRYKALDQSKNIVNGVVKGNKPYLLILELSQSGLQVCDLRSIKQSEYLIEEKLKRLKKRFGDNEQTIEEYKKSQYINQTKKFIHSKSSTKWWLLSVMILCVIIIILIVVR